MAVCVLTYSEALATMSEPIILFGPRKPLLKRYETDDQVQLLQERLDINQFDFMPLTGFYGHQENIQLRAIAVTLIDKLSRCEHFDAFVPYLAVNYFDRFLSRRLEIPELEDNKNKNLILLAICCVSLSWKMRSEKFSLTEFLKRSKIDSNPKQIWLMELEILSTLKWQMLSVTAVNYMDYFFPFVRLRYPQPIQGFTRQEVLRAIIATQGDARFEYFKPSIIAATAILKTALDVVPAQYPVFKNMVYSWKFVDKGSVLVCMNHMQFVEANRPRKVKDVNYKGKEKVIEPKIGQTLRKIFKTSKPGGRIATGKGQSSAAGEITEVISEEEEEEITANFELDWPTVELEEDLQIFDSELERKPVVVPSLYHRAVAAAPAQAENCNCCCIL